MSKKRETQQCPECGEEMEYEPPHPAEPDTNVGEWKGGWMCTECEFTEEYEEDTD